MSIFLTAFAVSASSPATALGAVPLSLASIAAVFSASPVAVSLNLSMTSLSLAARTVAVAFLATDSGVPGASAPVSLSLSATSNQDMSFLYLMWLPCFAANGSTSNMLDAIVSHTRDFL